jgi:hypothetical protein
MKRFSMYLTPGHVSVSIQNGATRETSAATLTAMLEAMSREDRQTLLLVCNGIALAINGDTEALATIEL